jgi:hypothetical protein
MRVNPDGSLSSGAGFAEALLSFRYLFRIGFSSPCLVVAGDKVMAGETPASPATLELG